MTNGLYHAISRETAMPIKPGYLQTTKDTIKLPLRTKATVHVLSDGTTGQLTCPAHSAPSLAGA
jgi:hypothetical protein